MIVACDREARNEKKNFSIVVTSSVWIFVNIFNIYGKYSSREYFFFPLVPFFFTVAEQITENRPFLTTVFSYCIRFVKFSVVSDF